MTGDRLHLRLPATSANLGPGFDAVALALSLYLEIEAQSAREFSVRATGRNVDICSQLTGNLLIDTYCRTLESNGIEDIPLALEVRNGIPLGMGCGSSAAVRLAGVALAVHFGKLNWDRNRILSFASCLEGHPDNTAACWLGGFAVASWRGKDAMAQCFAPRVEWRVLLVLPELPLETTKARALLPEAYSRADVVANLQRVALLTAAFASGRGELLATAMEDRIHQPYRSAVCPLLPRLLPLAGQQGILGVALSGAGPAVLVMIESSDKSEGARSAITALAGDIPLEIVECHIEPIGATFASVPDR
jgi:homoserine kinase